MLYVTITRITGARSQCWPMCYQLQVPILTQVIATAAKYRLVACCDCGHCVGWGTALATAPVCCVLTCPQWGLIRV